MSNKTNYKESCYSKNNESHNILNDFRISLARPGIYISLDEVGIKKLSIINQVIGQKINDKYYPVEFSDVYYSFLGVYNYDGDNGIISKIELEDYRKANDVFTKALADFAIKDWTEDKIINLLFNFQETALQSAIKIGKFDANNLGLRKKSNVPMLIYKNIDNDSYFHKQNFETTLSQEDKKLYQKIKKSVIELMKQHNKKSELFSEETAIYWRDVIVNKCTEKKSPDINLQKFIQKYYRVIQSESAESLKSKLKEIITNIKTLAQDDYVDAAIYAHMALVNLHAFSDGNGRIARMFMDHILTKGGFNKPYFISENAYTKAINKSLEQQDNSFFKEYVLSSVCEVKELDIKELVSNCTSDIGKLITQQNFDIQSTHQEARKCIEKFNFAIVNFLKDDSDISSDISNNRTTIDNDSSALTANKTSDSLYNPVEDGDEF